MCEKCIEIDKKIEHYRVIASHTTDEPLLDGIKKLIEGMQTQKDVLHSEQAK